jgi:hypothetical protein
MQVGTRSAAVVRELTQYISLAIWAIIGFLFWVPFLARAIAVFSSSVLYYTMTNRDASHLAPYLETAINFYSRGFKLIMSTFSNLESPQGTRATDLLPFQAARVMVEFLSAFLFWGGIALLFAHPWKK